MKILKLVSLIVSHTKVLKLYFYKCAHFFLFLSLSTFFIHQFYFYTNVPTLIPTLIHIISTLIPCIPTLIPLIPIITSLILCILTLIPHIPMIPTLIPRLPTLIPRILIIPLIPIPDSPFRLLQIAR